MYNIPEFKTDNQQEVLAFMHQNPFAILTGCDAQNIPVATHVPLLIKEREGKLFFQGHIMKQTDHHKAFVHNSNVLAIFTGPHAYVSASWYTNQRQAGTWNYMVVHAKGNLQFGDEQFLMNNLAEITALFENNAASPSAMENLAGDYVQKLAKAIVAFEIEVTDLQHVFKLSQNKDEKSYDKIIEQLNQRGVNAQQVAKEMEVRAEQLFNKKV